MYAIKVKANDEKRWSFLTSGGGTTYLRIHASQIEEKAKADKFAKEIAEDNPDFAVKVVPF